VIYLLTSKVNGQSIRLEMLIKNCAWKV